MADEFKHKDAGVQLSSTEYHGTDTHEADGQTEGDVLYYDATAGVWKRSPLHERVVYANWDIGDYKLTARQLAADVATGTAPLVITSTTMVANLNADLLDGSHATAFVTKALFDANTILIATDDDTPVALVVGEGTIVGRLAGQTIAALTAAQVATLIQGSIDHGSISGLGDDDHTIYLLANGSRALTKLVFAATTELTIASGVITVTQSMHTVDTQGDAASDELDTINGGSAGMVIILRPDNDARTVVVKHNTGNIWLRGESDIELDDINDGIMLVYNGTKWFDCGGGGGELWEESGANVQLKTAADVDFQQKELIQAALHTAAADPSQGALAQVYFKTGDGLVYVCTTAYSAGALEIYVNTTDNSYTSFYGNTWDAQTFTTVGAFTIASVKLKLFRVGTVTTVTVSIRAVDGDGKPTGGDLASGTLDVSAITTDTAGVWYEITFSTPYALSAATKYAIVVRHAFGNASNNVKWRLSNSAGYTGGGQLVSTDAGVNWTEYAGYDYMFETYGVATEDVYTALVYANNVLTLDNTTAFTPDADYEPATKKYVDDTVGAANVSKSTANKTIYVDKAATGAGDGTSWTDAFTTIQDAIDSLEDIILHAYTIKVRKGATPYRETVYINGDPTTYPCHLILGSLIIEGEYYWYGDCEANAAAGEIVDTGAFANSAVGDSVAITDRNGANSRTQDKELGLVDNIASVPNQIGTDLTKTPTTGWKYWAVRTEISGSDDGTDGGTARNNCFLMNTVDNVTIRGFLTTYSDEYALDLKNCRNCRADYIIMKNCDKGIRGDAHVRLEGQYVYAHCTTGYCFVSQAQSFLRFYYWVVDPTTASGIYNLDAANAWMYDGYIENCTNGVYCLDVGFVYLQGVTIENTVTKGLYAVKNSVIWDYQVTNNAVTAKDPASSSDASYIV